MSNYTVGADALKRFNGGTNSYADNKFAKFSSGTTYTVKVLGTTDVMEAKTYSHFSNPKIPTFTAKEPSDIRKEGDKFVYDNPTPWDIVSQELYARSKQKFDDAHQKAGAIARKSRFAFGFFDVDNNEEIIIDVTANQAEVLYDVISKNADKLDKRLFVLSKTGKGKDTKVALDVVFPDDITEKQQNNADNAPESFDIKHFEGLYYEKSNEDMKKDLVSIGYNLEEFGIEPIVDGDDDTDPTKEF